MDARDPLFDPKMGFRVRGVLICPVRLEDRNGAFAQICAFVCLCISSCISSLQVHTGAAKWKNTHLPWFDDLSTIFGKDRATGHGVVSGYDVIENLNGAQESENGLPPINDEDPNIQQSTYSDESVSRNVPKKKQKKNDPMVDALYDASKIIAAQFEVATKMFIVSEKQNAEEMKKESVKKMKQINEELDKIGGITLNGEISSCKKVGK